MLHVYYRIIKMFSEHQLCVGDVYLSEHGVELLPGAIVSSLGKKLFDLLPDLILVQMPAVVIVNAGTCGWVGSTWEYTHTHTHTHN